MLEHKKNNDNMAPINKQETKMLAWKQLLLLCSVQQDQCSVSIIYKGFPPEGCQIKIGNKHVCPSNSYATNDREQAPVSQVKIWVNPRFPVASCHFPF